MPETSPAEQSATGTERKASTKVMTEDAASRRLSVIRYCYCGSPRRCASRDDKRGEVEDGERRRGGRERTDGGLQTKPGKVATKRHEKARKGFRNEPRSDGGRRA